MGSGFGVCSLAGNSRRTGKIQGRQWQKGANQNRGIYVTPPEKSVIACSSIPHTRSVRLWRALSGCCHLIASLRSRFDSKRSLFGVGGVT